MIERFATNEGGEELGIAATETQRRREIAWSDLSARIAAAREIRGQFRRHEGESAARFLDAASDVFRGVIRGAQNRKQRVNPDVLGHGKSFCANRLGDEGSPATGRQEN